MATPKKTTAITLEMAVGDAVFLKIAKMAHANNLTFNEQINKIVEDAVASIDRPAVAVPAPPLSGNRDAVERAARPWAAAVPVPASPFGFAARPPQ